MSSNKTKMFLLFTLIFIATIGISAATAADIDNDATDTPIIADTPTTEVEDSVQTIDVDNKDIKKTNTVNSEKSEKTASSIVVNNDNVDQIFGGSGYTFSDQVNEGDTLDFQGQIDKQHSIIISKPVNIISSTQDAVISLHSSGVSYTPGDPGKAFVVNRGASGSNITGLYLDNTQFWVYDTENVYFSNMSMIVNGERVGTGTGQSAIRYSNNITLDGCHIYTQDNGGSTSVALTISSNCTIKNTLIEGYGNVGNIVALNNPFNIEDKPDRFADLYAADLLTYAENNDLLNCTLNTPNGGGICEPLYSVPPGSRIENNIINATGGGAKGGTGGTFINNTLINGVSLSIPKGCLATGNVVNDGGETTISGADVQAYNNTFCDVTISGANVNFTNNTVNGKVSVSKANVIIDSNHIESSTSPGISLTSAATDATITNNYIVAGDFTGDAAISIASGADSSVTLSGNVPEPVVETILITDETYSNFFDSNGNIIEGTIDAGNVVQFDGTFNSRKFVLNIPITATTGENQAVFDKCTFSITADVTLQNVQFTGNLGNLNLINISAVNLKLKNATIDGVKTGSQNMINPRNSGGSVGFENCLVKDCTAAAIVRTTMANIGISIRNSEFINNSGQYSLFHVNGNTWEVNIIGSNFTDNVGQQKGAIVQVAASKLRDKVIIDNCIFERNTAPSNAGVIYSEGNTANITIKNSNFTDNGVTTAGTDLAGVVYIKPSNNNLYLSNNIMTGSIAQNSTDVYLEAVKKVYTDAKLVAEDASTEKDQFVDLKFKLTDDMGNLLGFKSGVFGYSATINEETIVTDANTGTVKTINATYPEGTYPITLAITTGASLFSSINIVDGELEVIGQPVLPPLTDETWDQYFNEDGTPKADVVESGSELEFHGTFTNRQMNINIPLTITTGETQAVFDGCNFTLNNDVTFKNVEFTGTLEDSTPMIISKANTVFDNVTFDNVQTNYAEMIRATADSNITINNATIKNFKGGAIIGPSATGQARIGLNITDSVFTNNEATWIPIRINSNYWKVNIKNSNFTSNSGTTGGVIAVMSSRNYNTVNIDNCIFSDNLGTGKAGVLYVMGNNANISVTNSNFTNNGVQPSQSGSSSVTDLAGAITVGNGNTNIILNNNIITGSIAQNGTDIYFELTSAGTGKIYTDAKLIAEDATTDKDQFVDLKFKLTDDMGNLIGFKAGNIFNYSVTLNDEEISYVDTLLYGKIYGFSGIANKTINATYPGGTYPITLDIKAGTDKFDSIQIINGELEVIAPKPQPTINYDILNDIEGKVAIEFTLLDENNNEISNEQLIFTGDITGTINSGKVYKNTELTEGEYAFNVKFEETDDYLESDIDIVLKVQKDPQTIIDQLNESLINNETALNNNITALEELQAENELLQEQINNLQEALTANETALAANQTALEQANEQIALLEQNIDTLNEQLEANKTALAGNQTALANAEAEIEELNDQVADLETALAGNQTALANAEAEIEELNDQVSDLEAALEGNQTALANAEAEIEELNDQVADLETALAGNQTALANAEAQVDDLNAQVAELETALAGNQTALANAEAENEELAAQVADLEAALAGNQTALANAEAQVDDLNAQVADLEAALEGNQTALANAEAEIEELNDQVADLEAALAGNQTALANAEAEIEELNDQVADLETALTGNQTALANAQAELEEANEEINTLNNQITNLESDLEETESDLADTQLALEEANEQINELKYNVSELELALDMAEQALDKVIEILEEQNKPKDTTITIDPISDVKYGDEIEITGLLVNEEAIGLSNEVVKIIFNDEETTVTTRNGEFKYTTTATVIGENTITAIYAGSDKYQESEDTYTFEVAKADTTITIEDIEAVKKGETVTITGTLTDHNGNTLANKVVRLLINNGRKTLKTDADGAYTFDYALTKIGENTITATFEGDNYYTETTETITVEALALSTQITIDPLDTIVKGTKATFTGTLTDENGEAIANAQVKLNINGNTKTLKTDSEGRFTHTFTMNTVGENTITATYAGSTSYEAAEAITTVEVVKAEAVITLDPIESVTKGDNATFTGKLTDANGKAIANAQVKITINGSPKTLRTDENGVFTHTFKMIKEGTNNITAIFNGNNDFAAAETSSTVEVVKAE